MPDPQSQRGQPVTDAAFTAPWSTPIYPFGNGGLDLASAIDAIPVGKFRLLQNAFFTPGSSQELTARAGLTLLATAGATNVHSVVELVDNQVDQSTYVWGAGTLLQMGASGGLATVDTGYSGSPLSLVPLRPQLSGDPWVFVGDTAKMRKLRFNGDVREIGLPAPSAVPSLGLVTEQKTIIYAGGDGWTANPGTDYATPPNAAPAGTIDASGSGVTLGCEPTGMAATGTGYWNFWGRPTTMNLNLVGARTASDDDLMHLSLKFGNPAFVAECRLYLVCSADFSESVLPGLGVDAAGESTDANQDFYVRSFRPADFAPMIQALQAQTTQAETARVNELRQQALKAKAVLDGFQGNKKLVEDAAQALSKYVDAPPVRTAAALAAAAQRDPFRDTSTPVTGTGNSYVEFGTVGIPLRRGDFKRYGNTAGRDWGTITGIIVYLQITPSAPDVVPLAFVTLLDWWLTGGYGQDTTDPAMQAYDYRYTHYDPETGAESNPSPVMDESLWKDALRRAITATPTAYAGPGSSGIRQRFYRRGGALVTDWYYTGVNTSNGGLFTDGNSDLSIAEAGTVETDHYQPVATVDDDGNTVLAQPLPMIFGPVNGQLLGLGDPYRPGYVYASLPNQPDHWPQDMLAEVCSPTEELMVGLVYGSQAYVLSRSAGYAVYPNLNGAGGLSSAPTGCKHGVAGRWAACVGGGAMWFVSTDGVYRWTGGAEECISGDIEPLFRGQTVGSYAPLTFTVESALRVAVYRNELWMGYRIANGERRILIFNILNQTWRGYTFAIDTAVLYPVPSSQTLIIGNSGGTGAFTHTGTSDAGSAIPVQVLTGAWDFGEKRAEKQLGDQILDADANGVALSLQNFLNNQTVTNPAQTIAAFTGRRRVVLDSFGVVTQIARNIQTGITWSTAAAPPILYFLGTSISPQPELTTRRPTVWDDLGHPDEKYVMGVTLDCDTGGQDLEILVEGDLNGQTYTIATLTVNSTHRHKLAFSWNAQNAHKVRLHPCTECEPWLLYRADWIWQNEPPNVATWDSYFENAWDQYYTGLDLFVNTYGQPKTVIVQVDGVTLLNPATGDPYWIVQTTRREVVHLTLPTGRGHVFRFYATDQHPGMLFSHKWHLIEEPSEQTNWNAPYTLLGTQADKYLKALVFETDTFGQVKTVAVEADGVIVDTLEVQTNGRKVVQLALNGGQKLGRVWRVIPTDAHPSRLYSLRPVFDEEPFALTRFESQWIDHGEDGWHYLEQAMVSLKSTDVVTLTLQTVVNQATGAIVEKTYTIPSTAGAKLKKFVPFEAVNGTLWKYIFTCDAPLYLYMEESFVDLQSWVGGGLRRVHPFGNTGADLPTRSMLNSTLAAARSGGGD